MKTSDKLILSLFGLVLAALFGFNLTLKAEYDKIDFNDPLYGYEPTAVRPWKVLKITGTHQEKIQYQPGKAFEIRVQELNKQRLAQRVSGDTLIVSYTPERLRKDARPGESFDEVPVAYVMAPALTTVIVDGATCSLKNINQPNLSIRQTGGGLELLGSTIGNLTIDASRGSAIRAGIASQIRQASVTVRDSSRLEVNQDGFGSLQLRADSTAMLRLPGSLLRKATF